MMKYGKCLLILIILFLSKNVYAKSYLTGPETDTKSGTVYSKSSGKEESICTQSGSGINSNAFTVTEGKGKCETSGHVRSGTTDKCCPSGYSLSGSTCEKFENVSGDRYYEPTGGRCRSGYTRAGYYCESSDYGNCPTGYERSNGRCRTTATPSAYLYGYDVKIDVVGQQNCGSGKVVCKGDAEGEVSINILKAYKEWAGPFSCRGPGGHCWVKTQPKFVGQLSNSPGSVGVVAEGGGGYQDGLYHYAMYKTRGCGDYSNAVIPGYEPPEISGCWRRKIVNSSNGDIYGDTDNYEYKWDYVADCGNKKCNTTLPKDGKGEWELYKLAGEDEMTEELCARKKNSICQPTSPAELNKQKQANYCNEKNVNVPLDENTKCETNGNKFYKIECVENVSADYNPINFEKVLVNGNYIDEKIAVVQPGTGFKYNVNLNHVRTCSGKFNVDDDKDENTFNRVFDNTVEILRRADIFGDEREYAWYSSILDAINLISQTYEDQYKNIVEQGKHLYNYVGTISFDYQWQKNNYTKTTDFVMNKDEEKIYLDENNPILSKSHNVKTGVPKFVNHKLVSGITTKKLYDFTYTLHQESLLEPKRVYIDSKTGNEVESGIDAGNKVFTEIKTDVTKDENYKISTQINIYKKSAPSKAIVTISNEKCELKVISDKIVYRIIEPTNPFVNSARKIPKNWNGSIADFTKIINPNIGSTLIK